MHVYVLIPVIDYAYEIDIHGDHRRLDYKRDITQFAALRSNSHGLCFADNNSGEYTAVVRAV